MEKGGERASPISVYLSPWAVRRERVGSADEEFVVA